MSTAQAEGSLAKMTSNQAENSQTSTGDSYTQAIINKDQSEQRKEDGSSGIFLINDQKNMESTDEKDKTNKK
ncbi:unnamed protein product [Adineta steineri]|uniref:Uncharacterized protein n=1 Tax=Adineta steineri TaxID=433720 RepID=A0A814JR58_9BILA|nr:unnamed protein product [Adineta steineri]CAF1039050.1 unnamed protein product [Adineta steineri]CAF1054998.1 unnamed protein product [Adineta steineri]CAF3656751.1 unnamed protein product [Adineta steineri]